MADDIFPQNSRPMFRRVLVEYVFKLTLSIAKESDFASPKKNRIDSSTFH
jgi:hypothetical protein